MIPMITRCLICDVAFASSTDDPMWTDPFCDPCLWVVIDAAIEYAPPMPWEAIPAMRPEAA